MYFQKPPSGLPSGGRIAYVQVGDLVEMWVRRAPSDFAACEFCQTVNHQSDARCRTCGSPLPVHDEADPAPEPTGARGPAAPTTAARPLTNVMRMALLPPLLLFVAFAGWYQWRVPGAAPRAALAAAVAAPAPPPHAAAKPSRLPAGDLGLSEGEVAIVAPSGSSAAAAGAGSARTGCRRGRQRTDANAQGGGPDGALPRRARPPGRLQRQQLLRPRHLRQQPMRRSQERASRAVPRSDSPAPDRRGAPQSQPDGLSRRATAASAQSVLRQRGRARAPIDPLPRSETPLK